MTFFFLITTTLLFAPVTGVIFVPESQGINPYKRLIYAIGMVECSLDTLAVNKTEDAWGYFQIRPIRLNDYKIKTGIRHTTCDMLDYKKAEKVFMYYAVRTGPYDFEKIAKEWNGSGPKTIEYWNKVKQHLYE